MEPRPRPDPDFDPHPARPIRLVDSGLAEHQRVVVNPFLAVMALIVWWASVRWLFGNFLREWAVIASLALLSLPYLIHFHCLDCGQTGPYPKLWRHECPGILARRREDRPSRTLLPRARSQLVAWGYLIASAALILAVSGAVGR